MMQAQESRKEERLDIGLDTLADVAMISHEECMVVGS